MPVEGRAPSELSFWVPILRNAGHLSLADPLVLSWMRRRSMLRRCLRRDYSHAELFPTSRAASGEYLGHEIQIHDESERTWSGPFKIRRTFTFLLRIGRVYRTFAAQNLTSNDPDPFNFDSAGRADAENSARFTQQGNCAVMYFGRGARRKT